MNLNNSIKINIITLHRLLNCGSALQAFALRRFIGKYYGDKNVELIDYMPSYIETEGRPFRTLLRKMLFFRQYKSRSKNFAKFIDENCVLTKDKYRTYQSLVENPPKADLYITGSDQLWNPCFPCGNDPAYYLNFISDVPKISYSTSMGTDQYSHEQLQTIANRIKDYSYVSVREKCSVPQLESVGIKDVACVCDPTLLIDESEYSQLAKSYKDYGKYVAVYLVERSELLDRMLDYFRKAGYKIVGVAGYLNKYECDIKLRDAGPAEFLGLIRDADFVVATSFHATVFSLIFHKQFAIIPPSINATRIEQLLDMVNLNDRIVTNYTDFPQTLETINYNGVQSTIDEFRQESVRYLTDAIDAIKENIDEPV